MIVQDRGAYAKITDISGKLYIPLVYTNTRKRPCKRMFRTATEAKDYSKSVSNRYERLKSVRNQVAN